MLDIWQSYASKLQPLGGSMGDWDSMFGCGTSVDSVISNDRSVEGEEFWQKWHSSRSEFGRTRSNSTYEFPDYETMRRWEAVNPGIATIRKAYTEWDGEETYLLKVTGKPEGWRETLLDGKTYRATP